MAKKAKKELSPEERLADARVPKEEWPYELPEGWEWVTGHAIFESMESQKPEGEIFRYIDIDSIDNRNQRVVEPKVLRVDEAPSRARRKVHSGDTVFSMVRPYLKNIAYIDETLNDCIASTGFFVCKPSGFVNSKFLYWMMVSPYVVDGLNRYMKGDNSPSIRKDDVENYKYPLPPLKTQQRIVDHIESLFAKLDQAKEKAQQALATSESRKAAILHQAFTGQLTKKWREENGVTMESWEYLKIGEFAKVKGGKRLPKGHCLTTEKTAHPYLRIADFGENTIDCSDLQYIDDETFAEISKYTISANDVYLSIVGSIGKAGTIPMELDGANLTENAAKISTNRTLPKFLALFLSSSQAQEDIQRRIRSATLGKLSLLNIKDMQVSLPSLSEQQEIVHILDALMANERRIQQAVETILQEIDDTKKTILAKAFRGEWQS